MIWIHGNLMSIEKGRINVTFNSLYRIATALGVDVRELLTEKQ
jgi:transcriptional regulator with XRE-family HTH domain